MQFRKLRLWSERERESSRADPLSLADTKDRSLWNGRELRKESETKHLGLVEAKVESTSVGCPVLSVLLIGFSGKVLSKKRLYN